MILYCNRCDGAKSPQSFRVQFVQEGESHYCSCPVAFPGECSDCGGFHSAEDCMAHARRRPDFVFHQCRCEATECVPGKTG